MAVMLALLTLLAPLAVAGDHPATKIISMIQKLQEQVKEEGAEDTHVYGKFTYWCDETIKEKNKQELAMEVDKGMKQESELTLIKNKYRSNELEKEKQNQKFKTMEADLKTEIGNTSRERQHIESMKNEL